MGIYQEKLSEKIDRTIKFIDEINISVKNNLNNFDESFDNDVFVEKYKIDMNNHINETQNSIEKLKKIKKLLMEIEDKLENK